MSECASNIVFIIEISSSESTHPHTHMYTLTLTQTNTHAQARIFDKNTDFNFWGENNSRKGSTKIYSKKFYKPIDPLQLQMMTEQIVQ